MTTSSTANLPPTVFDRLGRHFGGQPADGKSGHAPGAVHVALAKIDRALRRQREARPVVVKCASRSRSRVAAKHLRGLEYDAASLSGGILAWQRAGGAVRR